MSRSTATVPLRSPRSRSVDAGNGRARSSGGRMTRSAPGSRRTRSEEHTSELQSQSNLVCRLLLEKKKADGHLAPAGAVQPRPRAGPVVPRRFHLQHHVTPLRGLDLGTGLVLGADSAFKAPGVVSS